MIVVGLVLLLVVAVVLFRRPGRAAKRAAGTAVLTSGLPVERRHGPGRLRGSRGAM